MRDNRRIPERAEVRLDRLQVVWLTLGFVVALGIVFALGVLVGKREARLAMPAAVTDPVAQIDADGKLHEELTFYERLTEPNSARGARRAEDKGVAPAKAPPPVEPKPAVPPSASTVSAPPAASPPKPAVSPAPVTTPPPTVAKVAAEKPNASEGELLADLARGPARSGDYTVQVSSFQTPDEAKAFASTLERKGYKPFVVVAEVTGKGKWYRVRLGTFKDYDRALSAKSLLARSDIPAWILKTE